MKKRTVRQVRDPMACITKRMPLADDQTRDLGIAYHVSLQAMLSGKGTEQAWSTLACSLNIGVILCEHGICAAALQTIQLAQDALITCRDRARKLKRWAFNGDEIKIIYRAIAIHDEQIAVATKKQVITALNEVNRRIEIGEIS